MSEKKQEFVVSDRRRFAPEGELRDDASRAEGEEERPAAPAQQPSAQQSQAKATPDQASSSASEQLPPPPTAEEEKEQSDAYKASGKKLDDMFAQASGKGRAAPAEMSFERLIESFYMTALLQLGAIRQEGEPPAVDILGARQTIDSLTILQEKTRGNLTEREQNLLQNILFELRMAWIEITNAIASNAGKPGVAVPPGGIKK
jgi:Domain of unknown function (DUF1844)